jgi:hypothetical protein
MRHAKCWRLLFGCALGAILAIPPCGPALGVETSRDDELRAIADDAYLYAYPLVLLDVTARAATNVATPAGERAPLNQFARVDILPDAHFNTVVLPNVDTLYTSAFLDLGKEPVVLHVPDTQGRYYLMPMLDAYTNVFASPGKRTTGTQAHDFAIVGPGWHGQLPPNVTRIDAPTNRVWILGRTQINGKADLPTVTALTKLYTLTPLSSFGHSYKPPRNGNVDARLDTKTPPPETVAALDDNAFFDRAAVLLAVNPPPPRDRAALARFEKIGLAPGHFTPSPAAQRAIDGAGARATERMRSQFAGIGKNSNGWRMATDLGEYGTRYLVRATVARAALGANLPSDAVYPSAQLDDTRAPLNGSNRYVLHFAKGQEPPVNAFWSLTMYGSDGYLVANPIDRFAIGNRDQLVRNADGSLDIWIQHDAPAGPTSANWLPAPDGPFQLLLRMYWPKAPILDGKWSPPPIKKSGAVAHMPRQKI